MKHTCIQKILNTKPDGRCGVGHPKLKWLDDIEYPDCDG
jgi:hypothetical protein